MGSPLLDNCGQYTVDLHVLTITRLAVSTREGAGDHTDCFTGVGGEPSVQDEVEVLGLKFKILGSTKDERRVSGIDTKPFLALF